MGWFIVIWTLQDHFTKLQTNLYIRGIIFTETKDGRWCRTPFGGERGRTPFREGKTSPTGGEIPVFLSPHLYQTH